METVKIISLFLSIFFSSKIIVMVKYGAEIDSLLLILNAMSITSFVYLQFIS